MSSTATTLTIRLRAPAPSLPARLAMIPFCAVPPETPIRPGGVEGIPSAGPYYIQSHTPHAELVLRRNPNYRGPRPHRFDTIDYRFGATATQEIKLVQSGRADVANGAILPDSKHVVPAAVNARLDRE